MIGMVTWSNDLSVGIPEVDDDHKHLVGLLNNLFSACFAGVGDEAVEETLKALVDYTVYHFQREERLLEQFKSPLLEPHRAQHQKLIEQVTEITRQGASALSEDVLIFLREWVARHIHEDDKRSFLPYATRR